MTLKGNEKVSILLEIMGFEITSFNSIFPQFHYWNIQMRPTKTAAYYISPIEIGVFWAKITYVKSLSKALGFDP